MTALDRLHQAEAASREAEAARQAAYKSGDKVEIAATHARCANTQANLLAALDAARGRAVANVMQREPYLDGTPNPMHSLRWNHDACPSCEDSLPVGTKLFAAPPALQAELDHARRRIGELTIQLGEAMKATPAAAVPAGHLFALLMCSDPWPVRCHGEGDGKAELVAFANRVAQGMGFVDWIDAYHGTRQSEEAKQAPPAAAVCAPDSSMDADSGHVRASLTQAPPADDALADTQRAIIEAAERRGYERGLKEQPAALAVPSCPNLTPMGECIKARQAVIEGTRVGLRLARGEFEVVADLGNNDSTVTTDGPDLVIRNPYRPSESWHEQAQQPAAAAPAEPVAWQYRFATPDGLTWSDWQQISSEAMAREMVEAFGKAGTRAEWRSLKVFEWGGYAGESDEADFAGARAMRAAANKENNNG